ncbi:RNP-1 like RNA-binding protein [Chondrocystis sp. NIES-4102]|nr:RNP-1 like RNA-binding protein [Chondrocystis sp. NIES-4102]
MSIRLYVGNLPKEEIDRDALANMFAEEGQQVITKVIKDRKTGKCRGFAFVTVESDELADQFIEKYNGQSFMDSPLKIEKALPRTKAEEGSATVEGTAASAGAGATNPPKRKTANKRAKKQNSGNAASPKQQQTNTNVQPDPRWADELAKLKEMLAATNN